MKLPMSCEETRKLGGKLKKCLKASEGSMKASEGSMKASWNKISLKNGNPKKLLKKPGRPKPFNDHQTERLISESDLMNFKRILRDDSVLTH